MNTLSADTDYPKAGFDIETELATITIDINDLLLMVIKPEKNVEDTDFEFEYIIVNGTRLDSEEAFDSETDEWYWRFYKDNFEDE